MAVVRPDNAQQARLLRLLRDDGPRSRAELGDAVELSRSRLAVELDRLVELGLVETAGLAASRGGRRSSIVRIARNTRFLGIDIGATSIDVAVTDGELRVLVARGRAGRRPAGPRGRHRPRAGDGRQAARRRHRGRPRRRRGRRARAGQLPRRRPGLAADHAGLGPLPGPGRARPRARLPGAGRQRRQHHGAGRAARRGRPLGRRLPLRQDRHRHRLRHRRRRRGLPRGATAAPATSATSRSTTHGPVCACGNVGCLEAFFGGAALARDALAAARVGPLAGAGRAAGAQRRAHRGRTSPTAPRPATRPASPADPRRRPAGRRGAGRPGQLHQPVDDRDRRRAGRLGHSLLAEIRSVVYRRSLPLATGNLPIVLSELGGEAGVVGAALLVSDRVYAA